MLTPSGLDPTLPIECAVSPCPSPGPWANLWVLAGHALIAHRIPIADTYAAYGLDAPEEAPTPDENRPASGAAIAVVPRIARRETDDTGDAVIVRPGVSEPSTGTSDGLRVRATPRARSNGRTTEQPAEKPENRMGTMPRGQCAIHGVNHGPKPCPDKGAAKSAKKGTPARAAKSARAGNPAPTPAAPATGATPAEVLVVEVGPGGMLTIERVDRALWRKAMSVLAALGTA